MAQVIQLTADQQTQVKQLIAALTTAQKAVRAAQQSLDAFTAPLTGQTKQKFPRHQRAQISDDGTALIVG